MDYINKIIQYLIDKEIIICGKTIDSIIDGNLFKNKCIHLKCYTEDENIINKLKSFFEISGELEKTWKLNGVFWEYSSNEFLFRIEFIDEKTFGEYKLILHKNKIMHKDGILSLLNNIKSIMNIKEKEMDVYLSWMLYLIKNDCILYGGCLMRYLLNESINDIDVIINDNVENLMKTLKISKVVEQISENKIKFIGEQNIIIDYHNHKNEIYPDVKFMDDGDAFVNILSLDKEGFGITKIPKNMNLINTLLCIFTDLKNKNYTLIKPFPKNIDNKGNVRIFVKPYLMEKEGFTIKYDYIEKLDAKYKSLFDFCVDPSSICDICKSDIINDSELISKLNIGDKINCMDCLIKKYNN
jgi:hypothetical protein